MTKKSINKIIIKFLNNEASSSELSDLMLWLEEKEENLKTFKIFLAVNYTLNQDLIFDSIQTYKNIFEKQPKSKLVRFIQKPIFKYAVATVALLISIPFLVNKQRHIDNSPTVVNNNIKIGTDKATLTLEDGTNIALEKGKNYIAPNLSSNGEEIIYNVAKVEKTETTFNYLTVPRGGQYHLKLSDGTKVWLNSESKLKYPIAFKDGEERSVELVYGEAYFDVSSSKNHQGSKFKVITEIQEVEVLGTEFNIKAYQDEGYVYTTLVEGKVTVSNSLAKSLLVPGQQSIINTETENLNIIEVDIYRETSWKEGVFSFRKKPLKDIMRVLARWYDMDVVFESKNLKEERFIGTLDKSQSIESILSSIKNTSNINVAYKIKNKTIYLK